VAGSFCRAHFHSEGLDVSGGVSGRGVFFRDCLALADWFSGFISMYGEDIFRSG
jgi:hypothetical protein